VTLLHLTKFITCDINITFCPKNATLILPFIKLNYSPRPDKNKNFISLPALDCITGYTSNTVYCSFVFQTCHGKHTANRPLFYNMQQVIRDCKCTYKPEFCFDISQNCSTESSLGPIIYKNTENLSKLHLQVQS
jgi:hypothetical protein